MTTTNASNALMRVLHDWGVRTIYGLPGGSFDSTMNAIHDFSDQIRYVGVRHEEIGALAAVAEAKMTGHIGVVFGSAGPGAVHLLNGLYDARTDNVPVLALIGQVPTAAMNTDFFQELDENPIFADVAVYDRTVMTAQQLPQVVDTAIRTAYAKKGVAVVIIPKDLGWTPIEDDHVSSANAFVHPQWELPAREEDVERALDLLLRARRPIIYFGRGARHAGAQIRELSDVLGLPILSTYLGKTVLDDDDPSYMVSTGRVATKPAADVGRAADLLLFIGTNYEFGAHMFSPDARFIDVNLDASAIGARHATELGIMADARTFLRQLVRAARARSEGDTPRGVDHAAWLRAAREDKEQWRAWIDAKADDDRVPVRLEPVYAEINRVAAPDAIFTVDVGNVNIQAARFLHMGPDTVTTTSPLYATMGYAAPAGIAAGLAYPGRQVWTISGDGALAMVPSALLTQAELHLPVINVVMTNKSLGFIEAEQDDTHQPHSGVDLSDVDFAKVAEGFGVRGYTVRTREDMRRVMDEVATTTDPVLVDVKVTDDRQLPVEAFPLRATDRADFVEFRAHYEAEDLEPFAEILARNGVDLPRPRA